MRASLAHALRAAPAAEPAIATLARLGLGSSLELVLDLSDARSYDGSAQKVLDRSGNGYDFVLGASTGASADDPIFRGTPGGLSLRECLEFDGGDFLVYDSANEPWMDAFHKASAAFTLATLFLPDLDGTGFAICGTKGAGNTVGFNWGVSNGGVLNCLVGNGSANVAITPSPSLTLADAQWQFAALSINEAQGPGGALGLLNDRIGAASAAYTSPSASAATNILSIGRRGDAASLFRAGTRLKLFLAWSRALTAAELLAVSRAIRRSNGLA